MHRADARNKKIAVAVDRRLLVERRRPVDVELHHVARSHHMVRVKRGDAARRLNLG
jgi:hypothetical protein